MEFQKDFFLDEVIEDFYVPGIMKRAWAAELQVLSCLDRLCKKLDIPYFLDYGSLLGAVRHNAFVPWDDDVDVSMYRKDFRRLLAYIDVELPKNIAFYYVGKDRETASSMAAIGMKEPGFNPEKQSFFQQFPFYVGVDICILEDILEEEVEKERQELFYRLSSLLKTVEGEKEKSYSILYERWKQELTALSEGISIFLKKQGAEVPSLFPKKGKSFLGEIYFAMDSLYRCLEDWDTEYIAWGPDYALHRKGVMKRCWYKGEKELKLPLHGQYFTVPTNWEAVLQNEYGDYQTPRKDLGGHLYPFYRKAEEHLEKSLGMENPFLYSFSGEDLKEQVRKNLRNSIIDSFIALEKLWFEAVEGKKAKEELKNLCQSSQQEILAIGNAIETRGNCPSVHLLQEICNLLFRIHEELGEEASSGRKEELTLLRQSLHAAKTQFCKDWKVRIVFLAYSYERFEKCTAEYYCALEAEEDMDIYLLPIPYGYKNVKGELRDRLYEGELFSRYYSILDYESLNLQTLQADIIVSPTAFDHVNQVFSLDPFYDTKNIKAFTPNLLYLPDFTVGAAKEGEDKALYNQRYYMPLPGIAHCDYSIFPKEETAEAYLQYWENNVFSKREASTYGKQVKKKLLSFEKLGKCFGIETVDRTALIAKTFRTIVEQACFEEAENKKEKR